jgi:chromosome segregation ATPase
MSSKTESAEQRFRDAFERLKTNRPIVMLKGTPVSQNNVAKEAGTDPSALRKKRYPALIRDIQTWVEIHAQTKTVQSKRQAQRREKSDLKSEMKAVEKQRDFAQSQLVSAHRAILELMKENARLQIQIEESLPPVTILRK